MDAFSPRDIRHDWTVDEIVAVHDRPLLELIGEANRLHRAYQPRELRPEGEPAQRQDRRLPGRLRLLPAIGASSEVDLGKSSLMPVADVLDAAKRARNAGADRFCMGAAWRAGARWRRIRRGARHGARRPCAWHGGLRHARHADRARRPQRLKEAGLTAYNHNLDTGPDYYSQIISTRTYDDRLATLRAVRGAGIEMCCGGIIGMGESVRDRAAMLAVLAAFRSAS